jgi:hypothetical protein
MKLTFILHLFIYIFIYTSLRKFSLRGQNATSVADFGPLERVPPFFYIYVYGKASLTTSPSKIIVIPNTGQVPQSRFTPQSYVRQDRQCRLNVTLRGIRASSVAVEK